MSFARCPPSRCLLLLEEVAEDEADPLFNASGVIPRKAHHIISLLVIYPSILRLSTFLSICRSAVSSGQAGGQRMARYVANTWGTTCSANSPGAKASSAFWLAGPSKIQSWVDKPVGSCTRNYPARSPRADDRINWLLFIGSSLGSSWISAVLLLDFGVGFPWF